MTKDNNEEVRCIGCGASLHSNDPEKAGFVPSSVLNKASDEEDIYCKRCFRLRHYNEVQDIELEDDNYLNMLHEISDQDALIVNLVDIFNFNGSLIPGIQRFAGKNPLLLIGNKTDLLPQSFNKGKVRQWMTERAHENGIRPKQVMLTNALNSKSVGKLMDVIEAERKGKDVYVVGTTNVGKSTLINQVIKLATETEDVITTSYFPGTTLGKIEIPLDDGQVLVDTPGVIQPNQLSEYLGPKELKQIIPRKEIKPKVYQLNEKQTLFFGGVARFDYLYGGGKQPVVCFVSNEIDIHRTKLENAGELYERQKGDVLVPPAEENAQKFPKLKRYEFTIKEPTDIVFSGLGWVTADQPGMKVAAWAPKGVDIFFRKAII